MLLRQCCYNTIEYIVSTCRRSNIGLCHQMKLGRSGGCLDERSHLAEELTSPACRHGRYLTLQLTRSVVSFDGPGGVALVPAQALKGDPRGYYVHSSWI
jgi:hypothetical protein